jgi:hypothetical protein
MMRPSVLILIALFTWTLPIRAGETAAPGKASPEAKPDTQKKAKPVPPFYSEDFEGDVGKEWSTNKTSVTPAGQRRFLGDFENKTVKLTLKELPPHKLLVLRFRLFALRSWDGYHPNWGPDTFRVAIEDGPTLLHTSFGHPRHALGPQAFPGWHGEDHVPSATAAVAEDKLGYVFGTRPCDAEYEVELVFPHTDDALTLVFAVEANTVSLADESWGLDDVTVRLEEGYRAVEPGTLKSLLEDIKSEDAVKAYAAYWKLAAAGPAVAAPLRKILPEDPSGPSLDQLLNDLQSSDFKTRQRATDQLIAKGPSVEDALKKAAAKKGLAPEQRKRIEHIQEKLKAVEQAAPQQRLHNRITRLLELLGSPAEKS